MLQDVKSILIQIFHRPNNDEVNKAILKELKKIRSQLRRAEHKLSNEGDAYLSSDSDDERVATQPSNSEQKQDQASLLPAESQPKPVAPPDEELDILNEDPNNPAWIRDPELGDGDVSTAYSFLIMPTLVHIITWDVTVAGSLPDSYIKMAARGRCCR